MAKTHGTLFLLLLLSLLCCSFLSEGRESGGSAAELRNFALPSFNKKSGRLEYILYGERAYNLGGTVTLTNPRLDMVRKEVRNINEITSLAKVTSYPLMTPYAQVKKYWADKRHSQALIFTDKASYDKNLRILRGDGKVYFRTPELSVDGVGFDADHERKFVHIRKNVRIVLYPSARKKGPGIPTGKK